MTYRTRWQRQGAAGSAAAYPARRTQSRSCGPRSKDRAARRFPPAGLGRDWQPFPQAPSRPAAPAAARYWQRGLWRRTGRNGGCGGSPWAECGDKAADELVRCQRHDLVAGQAIRAVVLVGEGDAALIMDDEPLIRDRHPVGVAQR